MVEAKDFFFKKQLGFSLGTGKVLQFAWLPFHLGYTTMCARKSRREDRGVVFHQVLQQDTEIYWLVVTGK